MTFAKLKSTAGDGSRGRQRGDKSPHGFVLGHDLGAQVGPSFWKGLSVDFSICDGLVTYGSHFHTSVVSEFVLYQDKSLKENFIFLDLKLS